jgi:hypothetical protein
MKRRSERGVTHPLKSADRGISRETERKRASEGHSLPGECVERNKSLKASERARGTHKLESA